MYDAAFDAHHHTAPHPSSETRASSDAHPSIDRRTVPFSARGPLSEAVLSRLTTPALPELCGLAETALDRCDDILADDDVQLSLFLLHASAYGSLDGLDPDREWDAELVAVRRTLETAFEAALRAQVEPTEAPEPKADAVARTLFALVEADNSPSLARYVARKATAEQVRETLIQRSIYTLREADPHSWAIPRLTGAPKAALVEIQADEYGGGRPDRVHAEIFARALRAAGLDDTYGAYVDRVPAITLASLNMMSMFGLNRRLVGAIVGHLAAYEMTSSIPCRMYAEGLRRLGFGDEIAEYFDEHVEADAVHEQIAARDLAGGLAQQHPELLPDILFGAAACLAVDGRSGAHVLDAWQRGESSLRAEVRS
ncbi:iron-containing redox enzyme family protein [Microbacterium sp. YJN-G]|uniref:iron-containing redox enzyme family protein n=1 Tax=Microbacterium sp. YJN-G TaxID=2763257 RepID=UPI0018787A46|nr:iron-containing redox enzyme family protein [Microbacterium sp. YJN-G]